MVLIVLGSISAFSLLKGYVYFASLLLVFVLPSVLLFTYSWPRINIYEKTGLLTTVLGMSMFSIAVEFIGIKYEFWTFSEHQDKLLGIHIGDIPLEEFLFYYAATAQLCCVYIAIKTAFLVHGITSKGFHDWLEQKKSQAFSGKGISWAGHLASGITAAALLLVFRRSAHAGVARAKLSGALRFHRGIPRFSSGRYFPGWAMAVGPFFFTALVAFRKFFRSIHIPALFFTFVINMSTYLLWEYNAIVRGHWVYNDQRILGPRLGVTPIEELFLYTTAILLGVSLYEATRSVLVQMYSSCPDTNTTTASEKTR